jgi:nucleoside-diphosphate-sugar epimerase
MSKLKILLCGFGFTSRYFILNFDYEFKILSRNKLDSLYEWRQDFLPDIVIDTIPPVFKENFMMNPIYKDILLNLYDKKKFVYIHISSTSVYPELPIEFNEKSEIPIESLNERGKKRYLLEEKILSNFPFALILRCGGIYGPGRNLVESLKNKNYQHIPETNKIVYRIHVYDLCNLMIHLGINLLNSGIENSLYNGYNRNNLINAVYPENEPIKNVLEFIKKYYKIPIPDKYFQLEKPALERKITSLYIKNFPYRFSDFRKGFIQCVPLI